MSSIFLKLVIGNSMVLIWYLLYRTILARFTHYHLNRAYLLFGLIIPVIALLLDINPVLREFRSFDIAIGRSADQALFMQAYDKILALEEWRFFSYLYILGLLLLLLKLAGQTFSLIQLHRCSKKLIIFGFQIRQLRQDIPPFSFLRRIYLNPKIHKAEDIKMILSHENIHIGQWHTVDIVAARLVATLLWFNPILLILATAIRQNLEYIADKEVLQLCSNRKDYQYSLLRASMRKSSNQLTNFYTNTDLKKRIIKMNRQASSPASLAWYGIIPALVTISLCLANGFQGHIDGHYSFYKQMINPEFLELQAKAQNHQLSKEFRQIEKPPN